MNKRLIAAMLAAGLGLPGIGYADMSVYGSLQVELANVSNDGFGENVCSGDRTCIAAGQSGIKLKDNERGRLGVKVVEDLGRGLKAVARYEWQIDTANGNLNDDDREAWVGLRGSFGEILAGRQKTPYKYTGGVNYDPLVATYLEARKSGGMKGGAMGQDDFWDKVLSYRNAWGGVSLWIVYGVDEGDGTSTDPGNKGDYSAALKYSGSQWEVFAAINSDNDTDDQVVKTGGQVRFDNGDQILSAQYELDKPQGDDNDASIYFIGYQLILGRNLLALQYGSTSGDAGYLGLRDDGGTPASPLVTDATYYAIGAIHKFNKKVSLFVGYRKSSDKNGSRDLSVMSAGLRVDF